VIDSSGIPYTVTTSDFSLDDKKFVESYYSQVGNDEYMAIGIVLCAITGIFFLFGVFIYNKKVNQ
jgi:hypothetical protein